MSKLRLVTAALYITCQSVIVILRLCKLLCRSCINKLSAERKPEEETGGVNGSSYNAVLLGLTVTIIT